MRRAVLLFVTGCGFSLAGGGADDQPVDAAPDTLPATCSQGQRACDGRNTLSCGPDQMWIADATCDFTCAEGACVEPSNVTLAEVASCGPSAPRLAPPPGSTVTVTAAGGVRVNCMPHCGDLAVTTIAATLAAAGPGLAWFCVSSLELAADVTVGLPVTGGPSQAIAFVVDGAATIGATISFDGSNATSSSGGEGAPGGLDGVDLTAGAGAGGGGGACGGAGGAQAGVSNNYGAGGGGGAGGATAGQGGGDGRSPNNDQTGTGGGGGASCGVAALIPLTGGAGGGGGGDGSCGGDCGWPSGGGGGAIQISSRVAITVAGTIRARGGNGYGVAAGAGGNGGGGGGGGGGAILLEAPAIAVTGSLIVDGGNGGPSAAGAGGTGATGGAGATAGINFASAGQGGSGGGAAGGRIRINAPMSTCPAGASPAASCTTGALALP